MGNNIKIISDRKEILKFFAFFAVINALLLYYIHDIIITDPQHFTGGNARSVDLFRKVWRFIYVVSPLYEFSKLIFISGLIYQAIKHFIQIKVQFWGILYIVLLAQMIFLIPDFLELIWFTFIKTDYSMSDVDNFNPLSLINLINHENLSDLSYELLCSINLFNILYWSLLVFLIKKYLKATFKQSVLVVFCFYGPLTFIYSFVFYLFT